MSIEFTWDTAKAAINLRRHGISFAEAVEAFFDPNAMDDYDAEHSDTETRHNLIGFSSRRLLFVVYTEPADGIIRIISVRKAEGKYQRIYDDKGAE